jgi:hypothetical protein
MYKKTILLFLFLISGCASVLPELIEKSIEERPLIVETPTPTPTLAPTPPPIATKVPQVSKECLIPFNDHTKCTSCPLLTTEDPRPEDVKNYLRFGDGKGHMVYTPSGHHRHYKNRYILLLTSTFGMANSVEMCGNLGCVPMQLSNVFRPAEFGFANDCRQHWKYEGDISELHKKTGRKNLHFKVRKNAKDYTILLPKGADFSKRSE